MTDEHPTLPYPKPSGEHETLVIPEDAAPAPRKRRVRWPLVLLVIVLVLAALVVAAEFIARAMLPGIVRGIVIEQLDLPKDQQLDVDAEGVLLPQLISGRLDRLNLSTESITFGGITGAADVTASGVPLKGGDLSEARGTVRIDQDQFATIVETSELPIEKVVFDEPDVTASGGFDVLGMSIPVALTVTPGVDAGDVILTPVELKIAGVTISATDVSARFGNAAAQFTQPQRICIADQLPAGLTVTDLKISGTLAIIDVEADGAIVTDPKLQENGVCD